METVIYCLSMQTNPIWNLAPMKTLFGAKHQTVINFPFRALFPLLISYINILALLWGNQMIKSRENFNFIPPISWRSINQQRFPLISFLFFFLFFFLFLLHRKVLHHKLINILILCIPYYIICSHHKSP